MAVENIASVRPDERIDTLDLLRGVAICGILLMNIPYMGMNWNLGRPAWPAAFTVDWSAWTVQRILFEGSMRGLFTLLFGAGMLVMLRRTERDGAVAPMDVFLRRCLALMALGVVQAGVFLWPGEILFNYGLTGFFILLFRKARPRTLLAVSLPLLALFSLAGVGQAYDVKASLDKGHAAERVQAAGQPLTVEQRKALDKLHEINERRDPPPAAIAKEYKKRTAFPSVVGWSLGEWSDYNLGSDTWFGVLESFCFMLIGMALFRMDVLGGARPAGYYLRLALIGYGIGLPIRAAIAVLRMRTGAAFDFETVAASNLLYEPARLLTTIGHVGLLVWLWKARALGAARPVRALGRMALTTYSLQSILTSILFYGFGMLDHFGFAQLMGIAVAIWIVTGAFASWWLRGHDIGPAEWVLRSVAYGRRGGRGGALPVAGPEGALATA